MTKSRQSRSWIDIISQFVELFFKTSRQSSRERNWNQHVVPYKGKWAVRREGNKRITSSHRLQSTALNKAKRIARKRKSAVIIHREGGGIRERINYD